jgi:hypothetical protein
MGKSTRKKKSRGLTPADMDIKLQAIELLRAGWHPKAVAKQVGRDIRTIRRYAQEAVEMSKSKITELVLGDLELIRQEAWKAAGTKDLGNRSFWFNLYITSMNTLLRSIFSPKATANIDAREQTIVIPGVREFYREIQELRREGPPLEGESVAALPSGGEDNKDELDEYLERYARKVSKPTQRL